VELAEAEHDAGTKCNGVAGAEQTLVEQSLNLHQESDLLIGRGQHGDVRAMLAPLISTSIPVAGL
jgi:hypothetical protein